MRGRELFGEVSGYINYLSVSDFIYYFIYVVYLINLYVYYVSGIGVGLKNKDENFGFVERER